ncbi:hypothetical protein Bca52824_058036 [Brassica carinata]|uniref:Btz domain-containing protein n=1 Tax=Brassica carinata TaxID=52824 RepID=A0A8X7UGS3_BRACI|nr:hypothetical protein Bca52824_058036 [Brassica carinata]
MDAWGPPCDVEDDASEKDVKGAITNPMPPRESEPIDGFVVSAGQEKFSSACGPKAEAAARNGNKFKSGYNSRLEDGELREPYRRGKIRRDVEKNDVAHMNDLHLKKRSSSSSRRSDDNEELSMAPYKCFGRHDRSSGRGYFSGSGSRPPYVLKPPHPENLGRHGDNNQFYGRMHNWMSGNKRGRGNSPVFRRSRSRSPVPWNGGDRLSHPHDEFRAEERMMESMRFSFQERFFEDQEIGFMSPPRNRMPPTRFDERRSHDSGTNHAKEDDVEDSAGGNNFEMMQEQTRRADVTEDGGDDVAGSGFARDSWV